ncbi:kinesin-domain-containing protein [Auriculariales sp. MPI-PUGE-AT-0066]|nr:kinesin-domain-containing protein [Auriculariales sp. MPI-PUGE-AT-0066]
MSTRAKTAGTRTKTAIPTDAAATSAPKRTTRAAAAGKGSVKDATGPSSTASTATRKALKPRSNGEDSKEKVAATPASKPSSLDTRDGAAHPKVVKQALVRPTSFDGGDRESLKAYLRIRPNAAGDNETPYLTALSDTVAEMSDPSTGTKLRPMYTQGRTTYTFSRVFSPEVSQKDFFSSTALPFVRQLLDGESSLLFAYGVTNSGKTYTIQGGTGQGESGVLPRALDVLFNSIDGHQSNAPLRPARLNDVEFDHTLDDVSRNSSRSVESVAAFDFASLKAEQSTLGGLLEDDIETFDVDDTMFGIDRNYEYAVWVSYAEVYNEKIYDLLGDSTTRTGSVAAMAASDSNHPLQLKRRALALKNDPDGQGKYISGLREVRVRSREEARAVVKLGQLNRRVFGTLANATSSRSHGVFTIRLIRVHGGSPTADEAQCSRLAIVDLAGSERTKNTGTAGERLREAGAINKSLMVLGQCMEIMRANQRRLAQAAGASQPPKLAVVPFRHSKLTEIFVDFFTGGGRAAMIVNVNPYDTGFDENSHVIKFAALAREVSTGTVRKHTGKLSDAGRRGSTNTFRRVTLSIGTSSGTRATEAHLEIVEEDAEDAEDTIVEDDDGPLDGLVDALFEQVQNLRLKLFEAELRNADLESDIREEVVSEMQERMLSMQQMYSRRIMDMEEAHEAKNEAKIDMLRDAGLFAALSLAKSALQSDTADEKEVGSMLAGRDDSDSEPGEKFDMHGSDLDSDSEEHQDDDDSGASDPPSSPLAGRAKREIRIAVNSGLSEPVGLMGSDAEEESDAAETESYLTESDTESDGEGETLQSDEDGSRAGEEDRYEDSMVDDSRRTSTASDYSYTTHHTEPSLHSLNLSPPPTIKKAAQKQAARISDATTASDMSPSPVAVKKTRSNKPPRASSTSVDELDFLSPQRPQRATRATKGR